MQADPQSPGFRIWGADNVVYGPVELPTLVSWVQDERVTADTWVYDEERGAWEKASNVTALQALFPAAASGSDLNASHSSRPEIRVGSLRRVKILADLNDSQLERFLGFMELIHVKQFAELVKQGQPGDAMYLVLDGELRVRLMIGGRESTLLTLNPGDFFGEMALFDRGPRSADVLANRDSVLLKVSGANFERLVREAPELAAPILVAIGKTMVARIRADNKRFKDSVHFARAAGL